MTLKATYPTSLKQKQHHPLEEEPCEKWTGIATLSIATNLELRFWAAGRPMSSGGGASFQLIHSIHTAGPRETVEEKVLFSG